MTSQSSPVCTLVASRCFLTRKLVSCDDRAPKFDLTLELVAGQDATEAFYSLHRQEVLDRPQFKRLNIGSIVGQSPQIVPRPAGELSTVPYAEPTWLTKGYYSPYYKEVSQRHFVPASCLPVLSE